MLESIQVTLRWLAVRRGETESKLNCFDFFYLAKPCIVCVRLCLAEANVPWGIGHYGGKISNQP